MREARMRPNRNMAVLIDRQCCCQKRNETQEQRWRRAGRFRRMRAPGDAWRCLAMPGGLGLHAWKLDCQQCRLGCHRVCECGAALVRSHTPFPIARPNVHSAASKSASIPRRHRRRRPPAGPHTHGPWPQGPCGFRKQGAAANRTAGRAMTTVGREQQ